MRKAEIFYHDTLAGILTETNDGHFIFQYDEKYIIHHPDQFLTFTMPVTKYPYHDSTYFLFLKDLSLRVGYWTLLKAITKSTPTIEWGYYLPVVKTASEQ
jgi:HipA-like protein